MGKLQSKVTAEDHSKGDTTAKVTLVEYGDYQCPDCGVAYRELEKVFAHFGDKLRFVFRNFPLEMHRYAEPAAEVAELAASRGKFWPMHDAIYQHQRELSTELLGELATRQGLGREQAEEAIEEGSFSDRIDADLASGEQSGVHGTPTFFINGVEFEGEYDADSLIEAIEAAK